MRFATFVLVLLGGGIVAKAEVGDDPVLPVAHFAVVYPDAESRDDDEKLSPEASWLRRRAKKPTKSVAQPAAKKEKPSAGRSKSPATVTPLRRDRPKNEVDPPKTRRRPLGW